MAIRCYYWNTRKVSISTYYLSQIKGNYNGMQLRYGNAGDILNKDLIQYLYHEADLNIADEGNRLLLIGSILNAVQPHDIIAGIGWKGNEDFVKFNVLNTCEIYGLRGPLTFEFLKKNGVNLDSVRFLLDPGLLIKEIYNLNVESFKPKGVVFIPHYREYGQFMKRKLPFGMQLKKVDCLPNKLAETILKSEYIVTSSLHVVIFCHALNRPCKFVQPLTDEPLFKYKDYFASVDLEFPKPIDHIDNITAQDLLKSPIYINKTMNDYYFPEKEKLKSLFNRNQ